MFVDASAIVALISREEDADALSSALVRHPDRITSAVAVWEAVAGLARKKQAMPLSQARSLVQQFLAAANVKVVDIGRAQSEAALDAFDRFGKGRHPAQLKLGDCFAYACAKTHGVPLLFKGDDFSQTDIPPA